MTKTERENLQLLADSGAIQEGHFVYSSGRHGTIYIDAEKIFGHSKSMSRLCWQIAERFKNSAVNSVTGPAKGGVVVASRVADCLSNFYSRKVAFVPTEKRAGDNFLIRPAFRRQISDKRVLVVDDVLTTGDSVKKVADLVRGRNGNIVGVGVLYNRGGMIAKAAVNILNFFAVLDIPHKSYSEKNCPACKKGIPVNPNFGRGREFLARKRQAI